MVTEWSEVSPPLRPDRKGHLSFGLLEAGFALFSPDSHVSSQSVINSSSYEFAFLLVRLPRGGTYMYATVTYVFTHLGFCNCIWSCFYKKTLMVAPSSRLVATLWARLEAVPGPLFRTWESFLLIFGQFLGPSCFGGPFFIFH